MGKVVATHKVESLRGRALLLVQVLDERGRAKGEPQIAMDRIGVGPGEEVLLEIAKEAGLGLPDPLVPVDLGIVGRIEASNLLAQEDL